MAKNERIPADDEMVTIVGPVYRDAMGNITSKYRARQVPRRRWENPISGTAMRNAGMELAVMDGGEARAKQDRKTRREAELEKRVKELEAKLNQKPQDDADQA